MLETKRLYLKLWEETDVAAFFRITSNPNILPAAGCPAIEDETAALQAIRDDYSSSEEYKVVLKESGEIIGSIGLRFGEDACSGRQDEPEVGFWLDEAFQGRGYAAEALEAVLRRAREELRCAAVWGCHYEGNLRSARLLEKFGFSLVRVNPRGDTRLGYTLPEAELRLAFRPL